MGRTLALILEYDASRRRPFTGAIDGAVDFTKSMDVLCRPDRAFLRALTGPSAKSGHTAGPYPIGRAGREGASRGFPDRMNYLVGEYFHEHFPADHAACGWYSYPELRARLRTAGVRERDLGDPIRRALSVFRALAAGLGMDRVRMVYAIGS